MKAYLLSLAAGILVGVIYALLKVRSPAPPIIALVGLLGILIGEQLPSLYQQWRSNGSVVTSWLSEQVKPHAFGALPSAKAAPGDRTNQKDNPTEQEKT